MISLLKILSEIRTVKSELQIPANIYFHTPNPNHDEGEEEHDINDKHMFDLFVKYKDYIKDIRCADGERLDPVVNNDVSNLYDALFYYRDWLNSEGNYEQYKKWTIKDLIEDFTKFVANNEKNDLH